MKKIGVIGGGQLARMMIPASINLGLELKIFAETHDSPAALAVTQVGDYRDKKQLEAFARTVDVITFDHEHVPIDNLVGLRANGALIAPSPDALRLTHDKTVMRSALASIGMPQPLFFALRQGADKEQALAQVGGFPCVAKKPVGGYDGKGVRVIDAWSEIDDWLEEGTVLLEERVSFVRELAQLVARRQGGQIETWPTVETRQKDGVCSEVVAPAPGLTPSQGETATMIARTIADTYGVVGVLAVELFETHNGEILVNELAMRPHNSGHIFTELSRTSQFEQHLRSVADLPLGDATLAWPSGVMANVFGEVHQARLETALHRYPEVKIHSYQKPAREGRKAGHISVVGSTTQELLALATGARAILDDSGYPV